MGYGTGKYKYNKPIKDKEPYEPDFMKRTIKKMLKATKKRKELLEYLITHYPGVIGSHKIKERILKCCDKLIFRRYPSINKTKLKKANFCNYHKICIACATRRAITMSNKLYTYIAQNDLRNKHRYTMVLTIRHNKQHGLEDLVDKVINLRQSVVRKIRNGKRESQKTKSFFSQFDGMITSFEVTNGKYSDKDNGWHPHIHIIACSDHDIQIDFKKYHWSRYSNDEMVKERKQMTSKRKTDGNDSFSVNIEKVAIRDLNLRNKKIMDVFKYAIKAIALDTQDHAELIALLHCKKYKLYTTNGIFYNRKLEPNQSDYSNREIGYIEKEFEKDYENDEYISHSESKIGYTKIQERL